MSHHVTAGLKDRERRRRNIKGFKREFVEAQRKDRKKGEGDAVVMHELCTPPPHTI